MNTASGKPSIFVHIGTENTGTSTIQKVFKNRGKVSASAGLLYPSSPMRRGTHAHAGLVHFATTGTDCPPLFRGLHARFDADQNRTLVARLSDEIATSGCGRVLLSSEHLSSALRTQASVDRVVDAMRLLSDDVRVIVYLRPQYELFPSSYSTRVKGGDTAPCRPPRAGDQFYDYDKMLTLWEKAVGQDRMIVRLFSDQEFRGGDFLTDFFDTLDMAKPGWLGTVKTVNTRLGPEALEFLRITNSARPIAANGSDGQPVLAQRHELMQALVNIGDRGGPLVPVDMLVATDALFRESNNRVAARYFPGRTGGLFPPFKPPGTDALAGLSVERAVQIALHLWQSRTEKLTEALAHGERKPVGARTGAVNQPQEAPAAFEPRV